ncbi:MAG TPA: hypothetical protein VK129_09215, partial [Terriglobales bacterium]|nr:hypothetical protein [Terriglobales bacterium]
SINFLGIRVIMTAGRIQDAGILLCRSLPRKCMAQACAGLVFDKSNVVSAMVEFQCSQTHASEMLPSAGGGVPGTRRACWGGVARRRV